MYTEQSKETFFKLKISAVKIYFTVSNSFLSSYIANWIWNGIQVESCLELPAPISRLTLPPPRSAIDIKGFFLYQVQKRLTANSTFSNHSTNIFAASYRLSMITHLNLTGGHIRITATSWGAAAGEYSSWLKIWNIGIKNC